RGRPGPQARGGTRESGGEGRRPVVRTGVAPGGASFPHCAREPGPRAEDQTVAVAEPASPGCTSPDSYAITTAWPQSRRFILSNTRATCVFTVVSVTPRLCLRSALLTPPP